MKRNPFEKIEKFNKQFADIPLADSPLGKLSKQNSDNPIFQAAQQLGDSLNFMGRKDDKYPDTPTRESILQQWEKAADDYHKQATRSNSALAKRIKFLIRFLRGEFYSTLRSENSNLPKDLKIAKEKDVPVLKKKYPHLHDLPENKPV